MRSFISLLYELALGEVATDLMMSSSKSSSNRCMVASLFSIVFSVFTVFGYNLAKTLPTVALDVPGTFE